MMSRKPGLVGLTVVAMVLLAGVMAPAAMASPEFTASSYPATITGGASKGLEVFNTSAGRVECESHFASHSLSGASSTLAFTPTYSDCDGFGGSTNASVSPEECSYVFHATEKVSTGVYRSHIDISCPTGQSIKFSAFVCGWEVKSQSGLTTVRSENLSGGLRLILEVANIAYTVTKDPFGCPFAGTGNRTDGTYLGDFDVFALGKASISISGQ